MGVAIEKVVAIAGVNLADFHAPQRWHDESIALNLAPFGRWTLRGRTHSAGSLYAGLFGAYMGVLVEAISVIVRRDAINERFSGGWRQFVATIANSTLCSDEDLARVGFMSPPDVEAYISRLEKGGLNFVRDGQAIDIAVVDQIRGPTMPTEWLEFARLSLGGAENKVAACWLFEEPRLCAGVHMPANGITIAIPDGWTYEDSLSANFKFVENQETQEN